MTVRAARYALAGRWQRLSTGSVNRRIFSAALIVGALTLSVKLASMGRDVLVAAGFGAGDAVDAFYIALLLPSFLIQVVATSLTNALVPAYAQVRQQEGPAAAGRLVSSVVVVSLALLALLAAGLALVGPLLLPRLASGFGPAKLALTQGLFYLLLPTIVFNGLATIWGAVLNAGERFALSSLAGVMVPLASIAALLVLRDAWGIYALAAGYTAGFVLQVGVLAIGLRRHGVELRPHWPRLTPALRQVLGQYVPVAAGALILSSTVLVDQSIAAVLSPGSVAALNYGNKIVALVLGVSTMALGTAVLPYFSRMVAAADWAGVRHSLRTYVRLILVLTVPGTALAVALSHPLVALLYQRGQFTGADTALVSQVQAMYLLQVPFFTLGMLFVQLISSLRANHILMWGNAISFTLNFTLDVVLLRVFGVAGIALSTTLVYVVACTFLGLMLRRRLRQVTAAA